MNLSTTVKKVGKLFTDEAKRAVIAAAEPQLSAASDFLAGQVQSKAPVGVGKLRQSVVKTGRGLSHGVRVGEWYAIPIEAGQKPARLNRKGIEAVALWAQRKLGMDSKEAVSFAFAVSARRARQFRAANKFFYGTYDELKPLLENRYLGPIARRIVEQLDR